MESPFQRSILKGKVALITGGGSGIGLEIAIQLAKHGANIALMGRRKPVLDSAVLQIQTEGVQAAAFQGDVRNKEDAIRVVQSTVTQFGRLDILVNNAAGNFLAPAEDLSPNGLRTVLEIDTLGTFIMSQAALHYLKKGGPGKAASDAGLIVNISVTLHYSATWYQLHVSAAKAAIDSMTKSLALEWGTDYGIRVNGVAPGPIKDTVGVFKLVPDEIGGIPALEDVCWGEKVDIAMAIVFLASDAARHINGVTFPVDGGSWLKKARLISRETVNAISRTVERKSRNLGSAPSSKL